MSGNVLLEYVMPVSRVEVISSPNLQYLHNALVIVKPKTGGGIAQTVVRITSEAELAAITDATMPAKLLKNLSYFYALPVSSLDLTAAGITNIDEYKYWTILIDPAFTDTELEGYKKPSNFNGVTGYASSDEELVIEANKVDKNSYFYSLEDNAGSNMYEAFGALLYARKGIWTNQQYMAMDLSDNIAETSTANAMFDSRVNFVLSDPEQYGNRLALFCVGNGSGASAIVAPYVYEEITTVLQGNALTWINLNEPDYTITQAKLLEDYLQKTIDAYIDNGQISGGTITVTTGNEQFILQGSIVIPEPSAIWRVKATLQEGVI